MYSEKTKRRAISLYESGLSCRAVARLLEQESRIAVTPQTIARWMRELGKSRSVGDRRTFELHPEAIRLYQSGLTLRQVAESFGVSATTVRERLGEAGVKLRSRTVKYARLADRTWLESQYRIKGLSAKE